MLYLLKIIFLKAHNGYDMKIAHSCVHTTYRIFLFLLLTGCVLSSSFCFLSISALKTLSHGIWHAHITQVHSILIPVANIMLSQKKTEREMLPKREREMLPERERETERMTKRKRERYARDNGCPFMLGVTKVQRIIESWHELVDASCMVTVAH